MLSNGIKIVRQDGAGINYNMMNQLSAIDENPEIEDDNLSPQVLSIQREKKENMFESQNLNYNPNSQKQNDSQFSHKTISIPQQRRIYNNSSQNNIQDTPSSMKNSNKYSPSKFGGIQDTPNPNGSPSNYGLHHSTKGNRMVLKNLSSTYLMKEKELHKLRDIKSDIDHKFKNSQVNLADMETKIYG